MFWGDADAQLFVCQVKHAFNQVAHALFMHVFGVYRRGNLFGFMHAWSDFRSLTVWYQTTMFSWYFMVFPRLGRRWLGSSAQHKPETSEGRTQMEQEKEGTCALWLFVSPKSSAPGIFAIAKISEPPKSRTCPSHLPFCQKGIFESYVMCLVSGRFCTYPTLCHLPLV